MTYRGFWNLMPWRKLISIRQLWNAIVIWAGLNWMPVYGQLPEAVQIRDLSGQQHTGRLLDISNTTIQIAGTNGLELNRDEVLRMDWQPHPESLLETGPQLILANGDRLGVRPTTITEESLIGTWDQFPAWPEVVVPLETVRGVLLIPPRNALERAEVIVRLRDQRETQDCFFLSNGDRLLGQFEGLEEGMFKLSTAAGKTTIPAGSVRAFGMNPELTSFPAAKVPLALLTLIDGSMLTVSNVAFNGKGLLTAQAAFGMPLQFPTESLVSLQFMNERIVYLSDLQPEQFTSTPYLSRTWPLRQNQNAVGGPLRLGSKEYARGVGMHSQSLATYSLAGKYLTFQATIGIDGATQGKGSVVFRVLADGKPVFTSPIVRGKTAPIPIGPLSLKGVQKLTLAVDFADHGDILDHANWCDAVLIKEPAVVP